MNDYQSRYDLFKLGRDRESVQKWIIEKGFRLRDEVDSVQKSVLEALAYTSSTRLERPRTRCRALTESAHYLNKAFLSLGDYLVVELRSHNTSRTAEVAWRRLADEEQLGRPNPGDLTEGEKTTLSAVLWVTILLVLLCLLVTSMCCLTWQENGTVKRAVVASHALANRTHRDVSIMEGHCQSTRDTVRLTLRTLRKLNTTAECNSASLLLIEKNLLAAIEALNKVTKTVQLADEITILKREITAARKRNEELTLICEAESVDDGMTKSTTTPSPQSSLHCISESSSPRSLTKRSPQSQRQGLFALKPWPPTYLDANMEDMVKNLITNPHGTPPWNSIRIPQLWEVRRQFSEPKHLQRLAAYFAQTARANCLLQAACLDFKYQSWSSSHTFRALDFPFCHIPRDMRPRLTVSEERLTSTSAPYYDSPCFSPQSPVVNLSILSALAELGEVFDKDADMAELARTSTNDATWVEDGMIRQNADWGIGLETRSVTQGRYLETMFLQFRGKAPHGMVTNDFPTGEQYLSLYKTPIPLTRGGKSILAVLRSIYTTDQATDCYRHHVNCTMCRSCNRRVICPVSCRFCTMSIDYHVTLLSKEGEIVPEHASDLQDVIHYQSVYLSENPAAAITKYPFMRDRSCTTDRAGSRVRWASCSVSRNASTHYNRVLKCKECKKFHLVLSKKEGPQPYVMGSVNYNSVNDGHSNETVDEDVHGYYPLTTDDRQTEIDKCPPDEPFPCTLVDADTKEALATKGFGLANLHRCKMVVSTLAIPVRDSDVHSDRVPTKWQFSTLRQTLAGEERSMITPLGCPPNDAVAQPIDGADAVASYYNAENTSEAPPVHFRQIASNIGFRKHLQILIHGSIHHTS